MSELIPAGYYSAVAVPIDTEQGRVWAQFGESKNAGTKQVLLHFEILDGPHAGKRLPWFGFFKTKESVERTLESLRVTGFKGDDLAELPFQQLDQKVSITVEHDEYNGKVRAKIAWVNKPGGGGVKLEKTIEGAALKSFAAQLKNHVKKAPEVNGEKATLAPVVAPSNGSREPGSDDDDTIPWAR